MCVCVCVCVHRQHTWCIELHENVLCWVLNNLIKVGGVQVHHMASCLAHTHTSPYAQEERRGGERRGEAITEDDRKEGTMKQTRY